MDNKTLLWFVIAALVLGGGYVGYNYLRDSNPSSPTVSSSTTNTTASSSEQINVFTVNYTNNGFEPKAITIKFGMKVTWVNKTDKIATVSSGPHPTHTDYPPLNLGKFNPGDSLSLVFDKAGTFEYHDHLNPGEKGTVTVQ